MPYKADEPMVDEKDVAHFLDWYLPHVDAYECRHMGPEEFVNAFLPAKTALNAGWLHISGRCDANSLVRTITANLVQLFGV